MSSEERKFGWKPDLPDHRDLKYGAINCMSDTLPEIVDLSDKCSPVEDQKTLGSCTSQALVGNLEFLELKKQEPFVDLSRLFVYYNERVIEDSVDFDNGAMLRDGIKTLAKEGVPPEALCPYDINRFREKPSDEAYEAAKTHKITQYMRLNSLPEFLNCLASGFPFVFGFSVYSYFLSTEMSRTGILQLPQPGESLLSGHAICCVGYNTLDKTFKIRNSWGSSWGQKGYFTMPLEYLENRDLSDDFWSVRNL